MTNENKPQYTTSATQPQTPMNSGSPRLAGLGARFGGHIIDSLVYSAINYLLVIPALTGSFGGSSGLGSIASLLLPVGYYAFCYSKWNNSLGKHLLGIQAVRLDSGQELDWKQGVLRDYVCKFVSAIIMCVGFIIAFFREDKRALHDLFMSTRVVVK